MTDPTDVDAPRPEGEHPPQSAPEVAAPSAPNRPGRWPLVAAAVLAVVAVVLAVQWLRAADEADDLARVRDDRRDVAFRAAEFGEAYLTYDLAEGDEGLQAAIAGLTTEAFARDYEDNRAPAIFELLSDLDTTTEATTTEVFVADVVDGRARAFVVIDVHASSPTDGDLELSNWTFVLDLLEEDGEWRVDAVAPAPQPGVDGASDGPAAGGSSTTVPSTTETSTTETSTTAPTTEAP